MMAFVRRKFLVFVSLVKLTVDCWTITTLSELGSLGKLGAEHSISENPKTKLSGYVKSLGKVFLLRIKLYYLKSNYQCSHIIENNLATIGYLDRNKYQKSVIINQSDLKRYLRKIIKVMN